MAWPPAGSGPTETILYFWLLWLLLVVGPVAAWIAVYYAWLRRRWDPHFRASDESSEPTAAQTGNSSNPPVRVLPGGA
jgi:hypothetical protein